MARSKPLQGRVAVITGAGRGIGQAIAIAYADAGAAVWCGARSASQLDETVQRIRTDDGMANAAFCDATDIESVKKFLDGADQGSGGIDIVVACAGSSPEDKLLEESDPASWRATIDSNLIGTFHTLHAAVPYLKRRGGGHILTVGSGMGHRSSVTRSAYAASKAGVWMLTRVLAQELASFNICVNELIPGPVRTDFIKGREDALRTGGAGGEWMKQPEDVAPLALFLATQPAHGPTGQTFSLARREL
jgi:3-oxoacyl-[acyl-carrier protein] reductase